MNKWGVIFGVILVFSVVGSVKASEGTVSLFNTVGEQSRCWAATILERNYNYKIVVSCRDLTYPAIDSSVFDYVLWVVPKDGKSPEKLGSLGFGKAEFDTRTTFTGMFVTKEGQQQGFGSNMGPVVMRGEVQPIGFLESVNPVTPTPVPTLVPGKSGQLAETSVAAKLSSSLQLGGVILRIVGIAFLLGIVAIVVVVLATSMGGKKNVPPGL